MTNEVALKLIAQEEGRKLKAYKDTKGKWHIGVGHNLESEQSEEEIAILKQAGYDGSFYSIENLEITDEQADNLFDLDYNEAAEDLALIYPDFDGINETRQAVLISQCFQLGFSGVRKFRNMIQAVIDRDWETAANESLDSLAAKQTPERWNRQAEMLRTGENPFIEESELQTEPEQLDAQNVVYEAILEKLEKNEQMLQKVYDYITSTAKKNWRLK